MNRSGNMGLQEEFLYLIKPVAILSYFPSLHSVSVRKQGVSFVRVPQL